MTDSRILARGDAMPHVVVATANGTFTYRDVWQHRHLFLVSLGETPDATAYASRVAAMADAFREREAEVVVTGDRIPGLPQPGLLVADRWGAIVFAASADQASALPPPQEALDWLHWVQCRC